MRDALRKELGCAGTLSASAPEIIGPAPLPFYKLRGHFRWHVMLKIPKKLILTSKIYSLLMRLKKPSAVAFQLDVDPLNIL